MFAIIAPPLLRYAIFDYLLSFSFSPMIFFIFAAAAAIAYAFAAIYCRFSFRDFRRCRFSLFITPATPPCHCR
jgi:hypothetical protein